MLSRPSRLVFNIGSRGGQLSRAVVRQRTSAAHLRTTAVQSEFSRLAHSLPASYIKVNKWNKAVTEAEKLVGYPTSYMSLRSLMSDDITNMAVHMRKIVGSDHPVLKTAKRLLYYGKNNMQVRGLLVLLLSRAAGDRRGAQEANFTSEIIDEQRKLAEIVEMIYSAQNIHQSVVNIPVNIQLEPDLEIRNVLGQLEYGNKISILSGDYLLANACTGLAALRITKIVELVSVAIVEFTQAEFLGVQDPMGRGIPTPDYLTQEHWEKKWRLSTGSLLGAGCESAMLVAEQEESVQLAAKQLGIYTALAIQAHDEMKLFTVDGGLGYGSPFSLCSAPVIFHLQSDPQLLDYIQQYNTDLSQVDYKRVLNSVLEGDGLEKTRDICQNYVDLALKELRNFPDNEGRQGFKNILLSLL
ncbi:decaprenyl-diphosphate synthase subunit 2 [Eurytemora carolleeae]|uniref:decaprenyl-diphosphate synthase subunit 2 n=1 Tax=Eurytemora carolleeae TaxID=1294199 RepID=UPI000C78A8F7|nr:decaprenyl-diphosphate synthase subunit 2 [Eurytemora carolleeae]|eukprot:XP_023321309.1 decaprenyl-diphosphate synthase subunit 2-like [Eurytemora affinis]